MIAAPIIKDGIAIWTKEHKKAWKSVKVDKSKETYEKFLNIMDHCPNITCSFDEKAKFSKQNCKSCSILVAYSFDTQRSKALGWH